MLELVLIKKTEDNKNKKGVTKKINGQMSYWINACMDDCPLAKQNTN